MNNIIYDIETYPNIFTAGFENHETGEKHLFEISFRKNQLQEMIEFFGTARMNGDRFVGFNNIGFDYPVLHFIIQYQNHINVLDIFNEADRIIKTPFENRFNNIIWSNDRYLKQIDLFKIHHFDNKAKATSLKILEFNMRMESIQDLPYKPGSLLSWQQCDELIDYMWHDIEATKLFYEQSIDVIRFREELSLKYDHDFTGHNDTKIGKDYFVMQLEKLVPGFNKKNQSKRDKIAIKDVILSNILFKKPEFNRVLGWLKNQTITETKGIFNDLSCSINSFEYVFGTGGIHGSISSQIIKATDEYSIIDIDVASYYPNLAIANNLYPEHLTEQFCSIYKDVYEQRKRYKKGTAENAMLKLALNGVYGDSNNKYSPFYDPKYTMSITINGQLLLCMLAEQLTDHVEMIQINTDGLTIRCHNSLKQWVKDVCTWWENLTGLELEHAEYSRMFIRDVNNYIAEYIDGKLKRKGAYEYELEHHKDHSALVVQKAVEQHLVYGKDYREFIENHNDPFDFMLRTKVPRSSRLVTVDYHERESLQQNVTRYFISIIGDDLVKIMPPAPATIKKVNRLLSENYLHPKDKKYLETHLLPTGEIKERRIGINTGWKVTICNNLSDFNFDDVEYDWYIKEAEKLIKPLKKGT